MPKFKYHLTEVQYLMLEDKIRTESYKKAIEVLVSENGIVADLGSGSGILSFFAAQKAQKVYSVEITDIIDFSKKVAHLNNFNNIEFIQGDIFKIDLKEKVDFIIHEQIGDYLWDEDLINKITFFRKKFLKKGGNIIPNTIELYMVPVSYLNKTEKILKYWKSMPYGIDFSPFVPLTLKQGISNYLYPQKILLEDDNTYLSVPKKVYEVNLSEDTSVPETVEVDFRLKKGYLTGILCFMKVKFSEDIFFFTNHYNKNGLLTHWKQIFLPLFKPLNIKENEDLHVVLNPDVNPKNWKWKIEKI